MAHSHRICNPLNSAELKRLEQFFGGYFHEDWVMDSQDPDDIVRMFIADLNSREECQLLACLIERYIANEDDNVLLRKKLFSELGCYYRTEADHISARDWLKHTAKMLSDAGELQP